MMNRSLLSALDLDFTKKVKLIYLSLLIGITPAAALQGGPVMPEYVKFEPSDITDIVNMSTGDFTYSIPLGDVPGPAGSFPISMSYHAGIGLQQEATWVGLGWTLNPGAINRMLRGYPDDINNSAHFSYVYAHDYQSGWGVNVGAGYGPVGLNMTYESGKGFGGSVSLGVQMGPASMGVDIGTNGAAVSAQVGMIQASVDKSGVQVGVGYTSPGMLSASMSMGVHVAWGGQMAAVGGVGMGVRPFPGNVSTPLGGFSFSSAGPSGGSVSIAGTGFASGSSGNGQVRSSFETSGFGSMVPLPGGFWVKFGYNHYEQEMVVSDANIQYMYGYMYQGGQGVQIRSLENISPLQGAPGNGNPPPPPAPSSLPTYTNFIFKDASPFLENLELNGLGEKPAAGTNVGRFTGAAPLADYWMSIPSYDVYSASGPGLGGAFRPYAKKVSKIYQVFEKLSADDKSPARKNFLLKPSETPYTGWKQQSVTVFPVTMEEGSIREIGKDDLLYYPNNEFTDYADVDYSFCRDGHVAWSSINGDDLDRDDVAEIFNSYNSQGAGDGCSPYGFLKSNFINESNRLVYSADDRDRYRAVSQTNMRFGFMNELGEFNKYSFDDTLYWSYGGKQIIPLFEPTVNGNAEGGGRIHGFKIIDSDGKQYLYEQPVYSLLQIDYSTDQEKGMPDFTTDGSKHYSWDMQLTPYASQWLLTEVRGADFIKISDDDMSKNYGYQIKLTYTDPVLYNWRSPYALPKTNTQDLPNLSLPDKKRFIGSMGQKELVYLKSIESATHKAVFNLNTPEAAGEERLDSREWKTDWLGNLTHQDDPPLEIPVTLAFDYISDTYVPPPGSGWEAGGIGSELGVHDTYLFNVNYQARTAYIPFRPTKSQQQQMLQNGIDLSGFSAAFNYYEHHHCNFPFGCDDVFFEVAGPAIRKLPTNDYTHYSVVSVAPTVGNEEQFGPYKLTFAVPVDMEGVFQDAYPDGNHNRDLHKGKVYLGQISYWQYGTELRKMQARFRPVFTRELNDWLTDPHYAQDNAPIPPKMRIEKLYGHNPSKNQARYLKSIDVIRKNTGQPLRSFNFNYDYSLCNHTPNSYATQQTTTGYPGNPNDLTGKLTLLKVTENGYDLATGEAYALPPYEFRYQSGTTVHSGGNPNYFEWQAASTASPEFAQELVESEHRTDPYGLFNDYGTENDTKVRKSGNHGVVWNLSEIKNPLGGSLSISLSRDEIQSEQEYSIANNGVKPQVYESWANGGWELDNGCVHFHSVTESWFDALWDPDGVPTSRSTRYFENLTHDMAAARFWPTLGSLHVGDEIIAVFHAFIHYESAGGTPLTGHLYFTATTTVKSKANGDITLNLRPADLPDLETSWRYHHATLHGSTVGAFSGSSLVTMAAIYQKNAFLIYGGDTRVSELKSCFTDCKNTDYIYDGGAYATRPDSVLSNQWFSKNLFEEGNRPRYFDDFRDYAGFRLGKNAWGTRGEENDLQLLPSSSITYGKVTVTNGINGMTVYKFYTPADFRSALYPIPQNSTDRLMWNTGVDHVTRNGVSVTSLNYHDFTSILGKPKSVTYYGSEWDATTSQNKYFMISKDSTEYGFGAAVTDDWESDRNYAGTSGERQEHLVLGAYSRYPSRVTKTIKYQFAKKVLGENDVAHVDHMKTEVTNSAFDPLTGIVTRSFVKYNDGLNPQIVKQKETSVELMSQLGTAPGNAIPKEMRRRNMLIQPLSERIKVFVDGDRDNTEKTIDYKLSIWSPTDLSNLKAGSFFKQADMVPTFPLPIPGTPGKLGSPSLYYSTGYNLGGWNGALVQKVDHFSHPAEIRMPTGTYASSYFSEDGFSQVGFALNAKRNQAQMATLNPEPAANHSWNYSTGASWRNGNFFLQKNGSVPIVLKGWPVAPGETYQISFRAKSRTVNANLSVDFISTFPIRTGTTASVVTQEGPQQNFTLTPAWNTYTATLAVTSGTYSIPTGSVALISPFSLNVIRFFNDAPSNSGLDYDIILDFVKIAKTPLATTVKAYEDWTLWQGNYFAVSNPNALYSSASGNPSVLQVPLDVSESGRDLYDVEFRARANVAGTALEIDFLSGAGVEGDQKSVLLQETWKKFKVTLDRRVYPTASSYVTNWLRFFCDSQADREIEVDYVRAYPEGALVNSFIHDAKGNTIESIDENNVSAYFTYDAFGKLTGMKNDPGFVKSEQSLNYGKK